MSKILLAHRLSVRQGHGLHRLPRRPGRAQLVGLGDEDLAVHGPGVLRFERLAVEAHDALRDMGISVFWGMLTSMFAAAPPRAPRNHPAFVSQKDVRVSPSSKGCPPKESQFLTWALGEATVWNGRAKWRKKGRAVEVLSILALVDQYLRFMHMAKKRRLDLAAEYLVMAAWLVYLKSKILLPSTAKEAIAIANNTLYGLGASVHSEQLPLALETAKHIKAGTVWLNCHNLFDAAAGFGGYKQSGYGREGGSGAKEFQRGY